MTRPTTQAISPFFIVSNVDQTIAFYRDKLGFETRFQQPDRNPFFAIIGRDGAQIFVKSDKDTAPLPNPMRSPSMPIMKQYLASPLRIPTTVFAGSRFATLTATSCSSVDQGRRRRRDAGFKPIHPKFWGSTFWARIRGRPGTRGHPDVEDASRERSTAYRRRESRPPAP